jgi:hypothetical protein
MADTPQTLLGIDTAATGHERHHHHPHIHGHSGKRLRHFFSPEGRKIHVAHSPDEADSLRKAEGEDEDFDFVIHGSPEHVRSANYTHLHQIQAKTNLTYPHSSPPSAQPTPTTPHTTLP